MATLVAFHAHPDDEALTTGGAMAKAAADDHRVVLVSATRGEHGEVPEGGLGPGESLGDLRVRETRAAAALLGVSRVEFLGYVDSGMMGAPENDEPGAFWQADVEEAARRLTAILTEERADVLTVYDDHGGTGHPDHIQVHRVGVRAAMLAGVARVYESTINRDQVLDLLRAAVEAGELPAIPADVEDPAFGVSQDRITTCLDVRAHLAAKRAAMAAHASQIPPTSIFFRMSPDLFAAAFGVEWYIRRGALRGRIEYVEGLVPGGTHAVRDTGTVDRGSTTGG